MISTTQRASWMMMSLWVAVGCLDPLARGQTIVWSKAGEYAGDYFGYSVAAIDDVDGDGRRDVLVSAPYDHVVYLLSGIDGTELKQWSSSGEDPYEFFGNCVAAAPDLDGDGSPELFVGAPNFEEQDFGGGVGHAYVYSARTGGLLKRLDGEEVGDRFGMRIADLGDLDSDGISDFAVSAPGGFPEFGSVTLYSGRSFALLGSWKSDVDSSYFGEALAGLADLDGDGVNDVLVGEPYRSTGFRLWDGRVTVYSGRTRLELYHLDGDLYGEQFGWAASGMADVDADGVGDFMVGAPYYASGGDKAGRVFVYSGATGLLLYEHRRETQKADGFGFAIAGSILQGGTPIPLVVAGAPYVNHSSFLGAVGFFTPLASGPLESLDGIRSDREFGFSVATLGDITGDGQEESVVGSPAARFGGPSEFGYIDVVSIDPPAPTLLNVTPSRGPFLGGTALVITGTRFQVNAPVSVLVGGQPATAVQIADDSTITCLAPLGRPGAADVTIQGTFGDATLPAAFDYTPELFASGDWRPGGTLILDYVVEPFDSIYAIAGLPPPVSIPTPPFVGELEILPFFTFFSTVAWPTNDLRLDFDIPDDPSLSGVDLLFQALAGPALGGKRKLAAWTPSALVQIR